MRSGLFSPARLDDALQICTRSLKTTGASFWLEQLVRRDGAALRGIKIQLVCLDAYSRPVRLPESLRFALSLKKHERNKDRLVTDMSMEATAVQSAVLAGSVNTDMSIWGLFVQADFVVKAVMIGLLLASFGAGQ